MSVGLVALCGAQPFVFTERAPATEHGQVTHHAARHAAPGATPAAAGGGAALGRHVGDDGTERVGRREPGPEEIPERGPGRRAVEPGDAGEGLDERGSAELEV